MARLLVLHVAAVDFTLHRFVLPLMRAQQSLGWRVGAVCADGPWIADLRAEGFDHYPITIKRGLDPLGHVRAFLRLKAIFNDLYPGIVHAHTPIAGWLARCAARAAKVPNIRYTVHGFLFHPEAPWLRSTIGKLMERSAAGAKDKWYFVSKEDAKRALEMGLASQQNAVWVGNGVDVTDDLPTWRARGQETRRELGISPAAYVVGYAGRFVREKGIDVILRALAEMKKSCDRQVAGILLGDALPSDRDGCRSQLESLSQSLGIADAIHFPGMVPDPRPWLAACDAVALPSKREGLPTVLLEAMSVGVPVIAYDTRGCRELAIDGETGHLVPFGDERAFHAAIAAMAKDPVSTRAMGERARSLVAAEYDWPVVIERYLPGYSTRRKPGR